MPVVSPIVDAHVHIFAPEFIQHREKHLAAEPIFRLLYADPKARLASAEDLIEAMDQDGIAQAVVCGFPWHDPGRARTHNAYILAAAQQFPNRLLPLATVDPLSPGARAEAELALSQGALGLGEIGAYSADLADPAVRAGLIPLAQLCAEANRPLLLHCNEPVGHHYPGKSPMTIAGLYQLIKDCPRTRFQLAHLGGGLFFYLSLKKEVTQVLKNCVFDTAAAPYLYQPTMFQSFLQLAGKHRLLFGSDFPLLRLRRYLSMLKDIIPTAELEPILGQNAQRFWSA